MSTTATYVGGISSDFLYVACGFIPIYLIYNFICYKRKNISYWIKGGVSWGDDSVKVVNNAYYEFQYKSSIKSCILLGLIIIISIIFKWVLSFFLIFLLSFHGTVFITKRLAIKKNYLDKL